jgi:hypothetical protein
VGVTDMVEVGVEVAATKRMVVKADLVKGVASGKAAMLLTTPAEGVTGVVEAVEAVVMDVMLCEGKTIVPGWAPLAKRLESKLEASAGARVCVWEGRVKIPPEARTIVTVSVA